MPVSKTKPARKAMKKTAAKKKLYCTDKMDSLAKTAASKAAITNSTKTRDQWEEDLTFYSDKELQALYVKLTGKDHKGKDAFNLTWGILDKLFPKPAASATPAAPVAVSEVKAPAPVKQIKDYPIHPAANLLPMMTEQELQALRADIQANGVKDPIALFKGQILDGRNRYKICCELGLKPPVVILPADTDPVQHVYSKAVHRNLTPSQKAAAAVNIKRAMAPDAEARRLRNLKGRSTEQEIFPAREQSGQARDIAASYFGISGRYVSDAEAILEADPESFKAVFEGRLTLPRAKAKVNRDKNSKDQKEAITAMKKAGVNADDWDIITGHCVEEMNKLEAGSVQLIFADPPYNEKVSYGEGFNDDLPNEMYIAQCQEWINAAVRLLHPEGSIFIMCSGKYSSDIESLLKAKFLNRRNTIAWHETFGSYTDGNFTNCWRPIHYYTKHPKNFTWHPDACRIKSWRNENGDTRAVPDGKVPGNVWTEFPRIVGNSAERIAGFPTQLPVALVERIVQMASNPGDLVLDPFNGSGTTGVAAIRNSRRYIGIERNAAYADAARDRLSGTTAII